MKTALITGAAIRIGKGIAETLIKAGYQVILHANNNFDELSYFQKEYKDKIISLIKADFSIDKEQEKFCKEVKSLKVPLDILVNNASYFAPVDFDKITRAEYEKMQKINLEAPFFIIQNLLEQVKKSQYKSIINIGDALWDRPVKKFSHYAVSKAGLSILTRSLAAELAPDIRVNAIAPGAILFPSFYTEETKAKKLEQIPFKSLGTSQDIGQMIISLVEHSPYVTGQIINVDGGRSIVSV